MDLATYLENSADGLMRGVRWMNENTNPFNLITERDAASMLPGAGIVEAGEAYQRGAEAWEEGDYLDAAGEYAYGALNQASEMIPAAASIAGAARIGGRRLPKLIEVFHGTPDAFQGMPRADMDPGGDIGIHVATHPGHASGYTLDMGAPAGSNPAVMPFLLDTRRPLELETDPMGFMYKEQLVPSISNNRLTRGVVEDLGRIPLEQWSTGTVFDTLNKHGFDSFRYWDEFAEEGGESYAVRDASQLLPRFDPNTYALAQQRGVTLNYRPTSRRRTFLPEDFR